MAIKQPPYVNGIVTALMDNPVVCTAVQGKLDEIRSAFDPTDEQSVCDTFYITATYNRTVAGTNIDATNKYPLINGDTAEACLALFDAPTEGTQPQEV
jgi:hypothetical protein